MAQLPKTIKEATINLKGLGLTETLNFNGNFQLENSSEIKMFDIRINPKNPRVYFGKVKNEKDLKNLNNTSFGKIEQIYIKHNEFAFYNYQIMVQVKTKITYL
jgi:hypothetical protein